MKSLWDECRACRLETANEDCYLLRIIITRIIITKDCYLIGFVGNLSTEETTECTWRAKVFKILEVPSCNIENFPLGSINFLNIFFFDEYFYLHTTFCMHFQNRGNLPFLYMIRSFELFIHEVLQKVDATVARVRKDMNTYQHPKL